ncbi:MAG TPA: glycogen debranching enzyme N-terminal domain-containing protein, partial [Candidatus Polarisedimenticolia bacterium]|nr:glycogen debranching enzyme N-terminal domain-containing protein [Candidatus Polarisedimenticolia bacterium]
MLERQDEREWLETDGAGGFASGTVGGVRTRRYHALLLVATNPPTGRYVLVNGFDATVVLNERRVPLTAQRYADGQVHPDSTARLVRFTDEPWPTWTFDLGDGSTLTQEVFVPRGSALAMLAFRRQGGSGAATLEVRPFLSGRDYHALHHENPAFEFEPELAPGRATWTMYDGVPGVTAFHNGALEARHDWYRGFLYKEEAERGLDATEDLASPGVFTFDLAAGEAVLVFAAEGATLPSGTASSASDAAAMAQALRAAEKRRRARYTSRLHRAADDYIVRRGRGATLVAGYPWFTDWGRDTFIALRGLCLATGRLDAARDILGEWAGAVSEGMLPNRFPDRGDEPEFNAVDASLWYVVAVYDYLKAAATTGHPVEDDERARLASAVAAIVEGYSRGTRFGIRRDDD